jgi:transposase
MIFPSNRVRFIVTTKPVDFRKGHDGLAALVKNELHKGPFTETVFVFRPRKAVRLKLILSLARDLRATEEAAKHAKDVSPKVLQSPLNADSNTL